MRKLIAMLAIAVSATAFADPPKLVSVCTDVVIRAYRAIGIDLGVLVHEDMRTSFDRHPQLWGLTRPDRNIDHRRVPNFQSFRGICRTSASSPIASHRARRRR